MKNKHFLLFALFVVAATLLTTCKKEEKKDMFNGSARIKGTVYFKNIIKGTTDTAKTATLILKKNDIDGTNYYSVNLTNGTYDISGLTGGKYTFSISYVVAVSGTNAKITYKQDFQTEIEKDVLKTGNDLTLTESQAASTSLFLQVVDANQLPVKNAQVCIYTDASLLQKNINRCTGSFKSVLTNDAGVAIFTDLTSVQYYATAFVASGTDTTSNRLTATTTVYGPIAANTASVNTIMISPDKPSVSITVSDQNGAAISGAQVCIYSDAASITRYAGRCNGSLKSSITDQNGIVTFAGMQSIIYYAAALKVVGGDTLSNIATILTPIPKLLVSSPNKFNVTLTSEKPVLNIIVTDFNDANISGAQVCIYSDLGLITKYNYKCTGSLRSSVSDQNGKTAFLNMQPISYYISASKIIGKDTLSNVATSLIPIPKLAAGLATDIKIKIK